MDACDAVAKDTATQYDGPVGSQAASNKADMVAAAGNSDAYEDEAY